MKKVQKTIKFENGYIVNSIGRAGRLALFWNNDVKRDEVNSTSWYIAAKIKDRETNCHWQLVCLYASIDSNIRKK